jgi:tetratricopeptide (TPR) repeat protein
LLLFLAAAGAFAADVDPQFKAGEELLDAWHTAQAEEFAAKSLKEDPKSPAALEFDGRVKFYQGRYTEALASLDRGLAIDSKNQRR